MNRIQELERKLTRHLADKTMTSGRWQQIRTNLLFDLNRARMEAHMAGRSHFEDVQNHQADAPEYDRQWGVDLHALARFSTRHAITLFVVSQVTMWIVALVVGA